MRVRLTRGGFAVPSPPRLGQIPMKFERIENIMIALLGLAATSCASPKITPAQHISKQEAIRIAYEASKGTLGGADPSNVFVSETNHAIIVYFRGNLPPGTRDGDPGQVTIDAKTGKVIEIQSGP